MKKLRKTKNDKFKLLTCRDNTFHGSVSSIFNKLPKNIRSKMKYAIFSKSVKQHLLHLASSAYLVSKPFFYPMCNFVSDPTPIFI